MSRDTEGAILFGRSKKIQERQEWSIGDPAFASWLLGPTVAGVTVSEYNALSVPAIYQAVSVIAGVMGTLPLKSYRTVSGVRKQVSTFMDNPHPLMTPTEWTRLVVCHYVFRGNVYLLNLYGGAGQVVGLQPIHPGCVDVTITNGVKIFRVTIDSQTREYTEADITHIQNVSLDGIRGIDPLVTLRNSIGTSIAGDKAAAKMFQNGAIIAGIVTTEEDVDGDEAKIIKQDLDNRLSGVSNASAWAFVNRSLKFTPWATSNVDGQWLESRQFQIEEVARIFNLPKEMLSATGASSWGTGLISLVQNFQKFNLRPIAVSIEQRCSRHLSTNTHCEYEFAALFQGTPAEEIQMLIQQVESGLITVNEARAIRNMPPLEAQPTPTEVSSVTQELG